VELRILGAHQLADLSKRLRAEGEAGKGFRRDLYRGIQRSTKEPKAQTVRVAATTLPRRGGLAAEVAKAKLSTRTRGGGKNVGVQIVAKGRYIRSTDRGFIRGTQPVAPGWFTETLQDSAPAVRREILDAMRDVANRIARG